MIVPVIPRLALVLAVLGSLGAATRPAATVHTYDVAPYGSAVLLARTNDIAVWDVLDSDRPRELHRLTLPATVGAIAIDGRRVAAAAGSHGLFVIDLDDETSEPKLLGRFDTPGNVRDVLLDHGRAILADDRYGIRVVDVGKNPARPRQVALLTTRDKAIALAREGEVIASAEALGGVRLWRLEEDRIPEETELVTEVKTAYDVALTAGLLLVAAGREGLVVFRLEDGRPPERLGSLSFDGPAEHVAAANDVAWVGTGRPSIERVDLADPAHPVRLEPVRMHRSAPVRRVRALPGRLLVAVDTAGLGLVDLSRPYDPVVLLPRERTLRIVD